MALPPAFKLVSALPPGVVLVLPRHLGWYWHNSLPPAFQLAQALAFELLLTLVPTPMHLGWYWSHP